MSRRRSQVIELRLNRAEEMFALAQTDLFSEYRNYLTGVEYCISVLRSQRVPGRSGYSSPCRRRRKTMPWATGSGWPFAATATSASATTHGSGAPSGGAACGRSGSAFPSWSSGTFW